MSLKQALAAAEQAVRADEHLALAWISLGLVNVELGRLEDADQDFERPEWIGEEVSHDPRYYNSNLSQRPYCQWRD